MLCWGGGEEKLGKLYGGGGGSGRALAIDRGGKGGICKLGASMD